ncbi:MAG TPA: DUF421 domain-containing protein, partial [Candidatus Angelobacter sp.]|nr:DUF421 domain-containing protein [Candidatus Angelobacter sp.]
MIVRTIFLYFVILLTFRLMGKREIGRLSVVDLVVNIMIAELCVLAIEQPEAPMIRTIIPIALLLAIQVLMALFSLKSRSFRHLVDGTPATIIKNGEIDEQQMKKQRYNFDDLMMQLREQNVRSVGDVEFAFLETGGKLSVIKKDTSTPADPHYEQAMNLDPLPLPLVLDGVIQKKHLQTLGKNTFWLRQELKRIGYKEVKN